MSSAPLRLASATLSPARVSAYPDRRFCQPASAPPISRSIRTRAVFVTEAQFDNADTALKPGMFATARVRLPGGESGIFVPKQAVIRDKTTDSNEVWVVLNGKAHF